MVHVEGSVPGSSADAGTDTIYVIEPHANSIYADAPLPYVPTGDGHGPEPALPSSDREQLLAFDAGGDVASVEIGRHAYAWRVPGVIAGVLMALFLYVLARLLFRRREVAVLVGIIALVDGMLFAQSRIGMNDSYVGLGIVAAYTIFAALWLHPGDSRRHWVAFALGVPLIGFFLGFALAAKWVAAYAIGGLGILSLVRSALGRLLLIAGLIVLTTALGYVAISVAPGQVGGNYVFLTIMVAFVIVAVLANILHPVAWTTEELRFAVGVPAAVGVLTLLSASGRSPRGCASGSSRPDRRLASWRSPCALVVYGGFLPLSSAGSGSVRLPCRRSPTTRRRSWSRRRRRREAGSGSAHWLGPAGDLARRRTARHSRSGCTSCRTSRGRSSRTTRLVEGWPVGHTGQTLLDLTASMYRYHNNLSSAHPASSPWWAWPFDLKPVWFYEEGFAGGTSGSIYDAGNLVAWWLAVPAMAFAAWQAYRRRSVALALVVIAFAAQWISWARIDRAAFQYHYYTSPAVPLPRPRLLPRRAVAWHLAPDLVAGPAVRRRAVLAPFGLWLFHRPLCAVAARDRDRPELAGLPNAHTRRQPLAPRDRDRGGRRGWRAAAPRPRTAGVRRRGRSERLEAERAAGGWRAARATSALGSRWASAALTGSSRRSRSSSFDIDPGRRRISGSRTSRWSRSPCS